MMHRITMPPKGFLFFLLLCTVLLTSACANVPGNLWRMNYFQPVESAIIAKEILRLEAEVDNGPDKQEKADSYYYLALLYAHYNNPAPDYSRSLAMWEHYLAFNPKGSGKGEALYLKSLLQKQAEADKERARCKQETRKLNRKAEKLTKQNEAMILENRDLKAALEKLEMLDLRLETQRQNF
jgi:hypothetical protein